MRYVTASAACALALLCSESAHAWGSLTTVASNTHGCIDKAAYAVLQGRPGFDAATFPKQDQVLANEGVSLDPTTFALKGPGPDADGASQYSDHYYNPITSEGGGPKAVRNWFTQLYWQKQTPKAAAWAAHFIADMTVPYHINGMSRDALTAAYKGTEAAFTPDPNVAGQRNWLSNPVATKRERTLQQIYGRNWGPIEKAFVDAATGVHPNEWKLEADRYLAKSKGVKTLDWFDPWYWNGPDKSILTFAGSSHLVYEFAVSNCPMVPPRYDELWPGNPVPSWGQANKQMADTVAEYAKRVAKWTYDHTDRYIADPDLAVINGASAVLTVWRASFSGLRVSMSQEPDPSPRNPGDPPVVIVRGKLENTSGETPDGVEMGLAAMGGTKACTRKDPEFVKIASLPPGGPREYGVWHIKVFNAGACKLQLAAKGHFTKTPDLQIAWRDATVTVNMQQADKTGPKPKPANTALDPCTCNFYIRTHPAECSNWVSRTTSSKMSYQEHEKQCQALEARSKQPKEPQTKNCLDGTDYCGGGN